MDAAKDIGNLKYSELVDLLGRLTKEYTAELASDISRVINDEKIYNLSLLIKEITLRERMMAKEGGDIRQNTLDLP